MTCEDALLLLFPSPPKLRLALKFMVPSFPRDGFIGLFRFGVAIVPRGGGGAMVPKDGAMKFGAMLLLGSVYES